MSIILKIPNSAGMSFPSTSNAAKTLYLLTCHLDHLQQWQWQQHQGWTQVTISTLALPLTLIKTTLCHSWRWQDFANGMIAHSQPSACPGSAAHHLHSDSILLYGEALQFSWDCCRLPSFYPWNSFRECSSTTSVPPRPMQKHALFLHNFHRFLHKSKRVLHKKTKIKKLHENRTCF